MKNTIKITHKIILATFYHQAYITINKVKYLHIFCVILTQRYIAHLQETPIDRGFQQTLLSVIPYLNWGNFLDVENL
jgi:hypothetical protein